MITLRLDDHLKRTVKSLARQMGISKSALIRKSICDYVDRLDQPTAWQLGRDVFGNYASGNDHLSSDRKILVKGKIRAKR